MPDSTIQPVPDDLEAARSRVVQAFARLLNLDSEDFEKNATYQARKAELFHETNQTILAELAAIREAARRPLVEALRTVRSMSAPAGYDSGDAAIFKVADDTLRALISPASEDTND